MSHITQEQRYTIQTMLEASCNRDEIASTLCKCKSVLSREINRNKDQRSGIYKAELAQHMKVSPVFTNFVLLVSN